MNEPAVLVTRPTGQEAALQELLAAAGYRGIHCPMLLIEALAGPAANQRELLQSLDDVQHLIFISTNAVRCGMPWIENAWPRLPTVPRWYAIGDGSAAALSEQGIEAQQPLQQMNSEGLLALPELQRLEDQRVLIVKGEGGREKLRETLLRRGARVDQLVCYQRRPPVIAAAELVSTILDQRCRALLLSSGEGLHNMMSLLDGRELDQVREIALVVPGARVAAEARAAGFTDVLEAANATDAAMVAALAGIDKLGG